MFKRMTLVLAATALAASGSSLATAATNTKKHKAKSHAITAKAAIAKHLPPGPIAQGIRPTRARSTGPLPGKAVTGAVRGSNDTAARSSPAR